MDVNMKLRYSDYGIYGFRFPSRELVTPILKHYFKSVNINPFVHEVIIKTRFRLGLPTYG